ncbi:MAG: hypothetical protein SFX74_05030 [Fimbriimonadaceae bacterium]|nr:hypothetical protein [Fimbriimonadaceae bacterium]
MKTIIEKVRTGCHPANLQLWVIYPLVNLFLSVFEVAIGKSSFQALNPASLATGFAINSIISACAFRWIKGVDFRFVLLIVVIYLGIPFLIRAVLNVAVRVPVNYGELFQQVLMGLVYGVIGAVMTLVGSRLIQQYGQSHSA